MASRCTKGLYRVSHVGPRCQKSVNAFLLGIASDFGMKLDVLFACFGHVAGNEHARRGLCGEHVNGCTHTVGIGVVRVVNQKSAAGELMTSSASRQRFESRKTARDGFRRHPAGKRRRGRSGRIVFGVLAADGKRRFDSSVFALNDELVAFSARCQIGRGLAPSQ